jgi:hypothetical protein
MPFPNRDVPRSCADRPLRPRQRSWLAFAVSIVKSPNGIRTDRLILHDQVRVSERDHPRSVVREAVTVGFDVVCNERAEVALKNLVGLCVIAHDRVPATKARMAAATSTGRSCWAR